MPTDLPNVLTLSRIAAIPLLVLLMALHRAGTDFAACIVFAVACITDYLDGRLARDWKQTSDFGRMLDPIADKLLVGAALMMLVGLARLSVWGLYPAIVIMLREILVSGLREYLAGVQVGLPVTRLAKWKTGVQMARARHADRRRLDGPPARPRLAAGDGDRGSDAVGLGVPDAADGVGLPHRRPAPRRRRPARRQGRAAAPGRARRHRRAPGLSRACGCSAWPAGPAPARPR